MFIVVDFNVISSPLQILGSRLFQLSDLHLFLQFMDLVALVDVGFSRSNMHDVTIILAMLGCGKS